MSLVLALDSALSGCCAGVVGRHSVLASRSVAGMRGNAAALPAMARAVLEEAALAQTGPVSVVVVTVGPGSFTGVRAALALAHGIGLGAGIPVVGVTVGEALRCEAPPGRSFWAAIDNRRGRVFIEHDALIGNFALDEMPAPAGPVAVAGDAAVAVASRLAARGADVMLLDGRRPSVAGIAAAALRGGRAAQPLYVDPPEARAGPGSRPSPC